MKSVFLMLFSASLVLSIVSPIFSQEGYSQVISSSFYDDKDGNWIFDLKFSSPFDPSENVVLKTIYDDDQKIEFSLYRNIGDPKTITEIEYNWGHITTLEIKDTSNGGITFSGGHFDGNGFPTTITKDGHVYAITYTTNPTSPKVDEPYKVTGSVTENGNPVTCERAKWDVFPENWTEAQVKAAVTQCWGNIKPTLGANETGGTKVGTGGGIQIEIKWSVKLYRKWSKEREDRNLNCLSEGVKREFNS
jgi:hypothetical protein